MLIKAVNTLLRLSPQQLKGKKMAAKTSKKLAGVAPKTATKKGAKACASSKKPATAAKEAVEPKKACCKKGKCSDTKLTRVIVKFDAGWGNQLYIRGIGGLIGKKELLCSASETMNGFGNRLFPKATFPLKSSLTTRFGARAKIMSWRVAIQ